MAAPRVPRLASTLVAFAVAVSLTGLGTAGVAGAAPAGVAALGVPLGADEEGVVTFVADGDTIDVDVVGDGTAVPQRIRFVGVNAAELSTYSSDVAKLTGDCHGVEAARRLHELVFGQVVRLTTNDASARSGTRWRREVAVSIGGEWRNVSEILIAEGHGLWLANPTDYRYNLSFARNAQQAAAAGIGTWDTDYCGQGPAADLAVTVVWDAPGDDAVNVNGEYVKVTNLGVNTVGLGGWWIRDSDLRRYTFPASAAVAPGSSVDVRVGRGADTASTFYWGLDAPVFDNATGPPTNMGDGGYLFDPLGNLRAWQMYP